MNVPRDELVGCDALILDLQVNIKFIEGDMNTFKNEIGIVEIGI